MDGTRKRPLKELNVIDIAKNSKFSVSTKGCEHIENNMPLKTTPIRKRNHYRKCKGTPKREKPSEGTPTGQRKISQYFSPKSGREIIPQVAEVESNGKEAVKLNDSLDTSNEDSSAKELVLKVNKLFMEDLKCPKSCPFSPINFSCSSVTSCSIINHKAPVAQLSSEDEQVLLFLICEKCWYLLLAPLTNHLTQNVYLSPLIIRAIFYGILDEAEEKICLGLVDIIKKHLRTHPPCRKDLKKLYYDVLLGKIKFGELTNPDIVKYNFHEILNAIEDTCTKLETCTIIEVVEKKYQPTTLPSSIEDLFSYISKNYIENDNILSLPEFNYQKHENQQISSEEVDLNKLLDRLFLVFSLTLDILEENFRVWWMKSRYSFREKLFSKLSCPLIAQVGWKKLEIKGSVNEHCIKIFMLFKLCPQKYRHHISRYIALLFEVCRANEENEEKRFPFFSTLCKSFANELSCHIKEKKNLNPKEPEVRYIFKNLLTVDGAQPTLLLIYRQEKMLDEKCDSVLLQLYERRGKGEIDNNTVSLVQYIYPEWLRFRVCGVLLRSDISSGGIDDLRSIYRVLLRNLTKPSTSSSSSVRNLRSKHKQMNVQKITKNSEGETPLHRFCRTNNVEALTNCLKSPATNVNIADNVGWTPLHNAAAYNSVDCVKLLLKYRLPPISGAEELDLFALTSENESPLMCAVKEENVEIVDILLKSGVGPTVWNKSSEGESSIDLARNDTLKEMLLSSWRESISTFNHLRIKSIDVELLTLMLSSYCSVYHVRENCDELSLDSCKHDSVYKFNYGQYLKDEKTFDRLSFLVDKLVIVPSNPKNLKDIQFFLKSFSNV